MSRSVPWRRAVSDACCWHQSQALESTLYILRQTGPTGFLLKEDGETKNVKVFLGDPHTCTCPVFRKEKDLCKHICWLLLRKFRLSINDPMSWQLGLVERELNEILQGRSINEQPSRSRQKEPEEKAKQTSDGRTLVEQRDIADDDVCPICQEEFMAKKLPVTFCKFGCGNSIHIKCMQVWAEHQMKSSPDGVIKCPMCREDFGSLELLKTEMRNAGCSKPPAAGLRLDRHMGITCANCSVAPIEGKCYRCIVCPTYYMCQKCFNLPVHTDHTFQYRQKCNQKWKSALRTVGSTLPPALVNDLMRREITENDYDILLQMERNGENTELSNLTESVIQAIPLEKVREGGQLLALGSQCRVCLRGFSLGQLVRKLPCKHKFHKDCIDSWLLHSHPTCPIDGLPASPAANIESNAQSSAQRQQHESISSIDTFSLTASGISLTATRLTELANRRISSLKALPHRGHLAPLSSVQLELLGTGFTNTNNISNALNEGDHSRELSAVEDRVRPSQAARLADHISELAASNELSGQQLINLLRTYSAASRDLHISEGRRSSFSSLTASDRGHSFDYQQRLRQIRSFKGRPRSVDRQAPSIQGTRQVHGDLFLGNNPLLQPPATENIATRRPPLPDKMRGRPFKPTLWKRLPPLQTANRSHGNTDMRLEGNGFEGHPSDQS